MTSESSQQKQPHYNTVNPFVLVKGGAVKFIEFVESVFSAKENKSIRTPDKDGSLIHAEIQIGDAMILLADSKEDWPFTPAFLQVYVDNAQETLDRAEQAGGTIVTKVSPFYNGLNLARFKDPFGNIWWLYERIKESEQAKNEANTDWHNSKPSDIYSTLMEAMKSLKTH
ncbi:hypothetical protein GCM10027592_34370 [Spirosoma flavus]